MSKIVSDAQVELQEKHLEVKDKCEAFERGILKSENLGKKYESYLQQIESVYFNVVTAYRNDFEYVAGFKLNAFERTPVLDLGSEVEIDRESIELDKEELPKITEFKDGLPNLFKKVEEKINSYKTNLNETVEEYISDIMKKAEKTK